MKKIILSITLFVLGLFTVNAEECNGYYKINIAIEGKGTINVENSEKEFDNNNILNVKCGDGLVFRVENDEGYYLQGVYTDGNHISSSDNSYRLYNINSNKDIKIIFKKELTSNENEISYNSYESSISLFIDDIKQDLKNDTKLRISLKELDMLFDNKFIKNSSNNITIDGNAVYKDDLSIKEKKAAKGLYYCFDLYNGDELSNKLNGTVEIAIPYSKSDKAYVYRISKDGRITKMDSSYDKESVSFKTDELGLFVISKEEQDEMNYVKSVINLNKKEKIAIVAIGSAFALLIAFIKFRKRK